MRPREVSSGVEMFDTRTPTLPPATHTNSYGLRYGDDEVLLVEPATPYDDERRAWVEWARAQPKPVAIVLTHHHEDHVGGAAFLSRELGLPLWAHADTASRLDGSMQIARILRDGETLGEWRVLYTPGHAPGHICLLRERDGVLVCGDMVASVGTILIAPGDGDMRIYLEQLARLEAVGASVALPAHGDPIDAPASIFRHYIEHRLKREGKVIAALRETPRPLSEILPDAYADTPMHLWPIAALSLQSHLDKLVVEGRAARDDENVYRLST